MFIQIIYKRGEVDTKQCVMPNFEQNHSVSAPEILQVALIMLLQGEGKRLEKGLKRPMKCLRGRDLWGDCAMEEKCQSRE